MPNAASLRHTSAFVLGWGKLPDELKLEIVRHALPRDETVSGRFFNKKLNKIDRARFTTRKFPVSDASIASELELLEQYDTTFLSLLACPETAKFVHEAFYTQNVMRLTHPSTPMLPPPSVRGFVRNVKLYADTSTSWWYTVTMVANGEAGFSNMSVVEIELDARPEWRYRLNRVLELSFHTRELQVSFWHGRGLRFYFTAVDSLESNCSRSSRSPQTADTWKSFGSVTVMRSRVNMGMNTRWTRSPAWNMNLASIRG
jgi:hypothetical protein